MEIKEFATEWLANEDTPGVNEEAVCRNLITVAQHDGRDQFGTGA
jgi:hypothetical protein